MAAEEVEVVEVEDEVEVEGATVVDDLVVEVGVTDQVPMALVWEARGGNHLVPY